jgi:hypothetical protein
MPATEIAEVFAAREEDYPPKFLSATKKLQLGRVTILKFQNFLSDKPETNSKTKTVFGYTVHTLVTKEGKILILRTLQKKGVIPRVAHASRYYQNGSHYGPTLHLEGYEQDS